MNQLKSDFFNLVSLGFLSEGYKFVKSQNTFVKVVDELSFRVVFKFEGQ